MTTQNRQKSNDKKQNKKTHKIIVIITKALYFQRPQSYSISFTFI